MTESLTKLAVIALLTVFISGCALFGRKPEPPRPPEVSVIVEEVRFEIYQPLLPNPLRLEDVRFHVITKNNLTDKIAEIERLLGGDFVVFAITPKDYENMAGNIQELRRYIRQLLKIEEYYVWATNPPADVTTEEWRRATRTRADELRNELRQIEQSPNE